MNRIVSAAVSPPYRLHLVFDDGTRGVVDVSDLAGRGVFASWSDPGVFEAVGIGSSGELVWPDGTDLCADSLYLRLTGRTPADIFPSLGRESRIA